MYVHLCTYVHVHTGSYMHTCIHTVHTCIHTCTYRRMYTYVRVCTYMHVLTCMHTVHRCMQAYILVHITCIFLCSPFLCCFTRVFVSNCCYISCYVNRYSCCSRDINRFCLCCIQSAKKYRAAHTLLHSLAELTSLSEDKRILSDFKSEVEKRLLHLESQGICITVA